MLATRIGDTAVGWCPCPPSPSCPATGVVVTGDPQNLSSGSPISRMGDIVMFPCGGFTIVFGSPNYLSSGLPVSTLGSTCIGAGSGIIVTGDPQNLIL